MSVLESEKLDKRTKWSYCVGATGRDMAYTLVNMFLLTYIQYTMKLSVAQFSVISLIVVVCLVWDAINDPMMGMIIENCRFKMGKYRPWILVGAILNSIVIVLLFTVRPQGWSFVLFFGICYLLWGMTYTMNDIAYWGMLPSLSSDSGERNSLVTLMSVFICIGQFTVAGVVPVVVAGNAQTVYRIAALIIALCFTLFQMLTFFGVKERPRKELKDKVSFTKIFRILKRNDQLVPIAVASLIYNIGSGLLIIFAVNFFYFEFGYKNGGGLILAFTVMYGLGTLLSQAIYSTLAKHMSRIKIARISTIIIVLSYLLFMMLGYIIPKNIILLNAIGFIIFFCQGLFNLVIVVMINNTIEYDEYMFNERHDSVIATVRSFAAKLSGAINQGISALVLIISGIYAVSQNITDLELKSGQGILTSEEVMQRADGFISSVQPYQTLVLRIGMVLIPILAISCSYIIIKRKYRIDEREYERIVKEINQRK